MFFNPQNPFPLCPPLGPAEYGAAKEHSAHADAWLGLRVAQVEARLAGVGDGEERWLGKAPDVFLTPYVEFRAWLEHLRPAPGDTVVDLGAGYGRLGFVLARHFPECSFRGYELVEERVAEGTAALTRFGATRARLERANIALPGWRPPPAAIYFIYDYGTRAAIEKTLVDLREISRTRGIVVVGRGRAVRDQVERSHPWLGSVHRAEHFAHYSIYRSA